MLILCLDCSVKNVTLALVDDGKMLASVNRLTPGAQATEIMNCVDEIFQKSGRAFSEITDVLFCHGPGSFTSLRVGLATLLGLFGGTAVKLEVVSSLMLRCLSVAEKNGVRVALIKMGRERFALGILRGDDFNEKIYSTTELQNEFSALGVSLNPEGEDQVDAQAFLNLLNSSAVQKVTWAKVRPHYLLDPDIG